MTKPAVPEGAGIGIDGARAVVTAGDLRLTLDLAAGAGVVAVTAPTPAAGPGDDRGRTLVASWRSVYTADGETWSDLPATGERAFARGATHAVAGPGGEVVARVSTPHLRLEKRFTVYPGFPFVRIRYRSETTGVPGRGPGLSLGLPEIIFDRRLADPFDLRQDTADDGAELDGGLSLPAWRAFADPAETGGLLVFAAERPVMGRLQLLERGCAFRPAYYLAYSTEVVTTRELRFGLQYGNFGPLDELDWFLGAYRAAQLPRLRRLIAGFHARKRPTSAGTAVEISPDAGAWDLPLAALPPAYPGRVTVSPGSAIQRRFVFPGLADPAPAQDGVAAPGGVAVTVRPGRAAGLGAATLTVSALESAAPAAHDVTVALPARAGTLVQTVEVRRARPLGTGAAGERVYGAAELAPGSETGWHLLRRVELPGGHGLLVHAGRTAPPLRVDPGLRGAYDVFAGLGHGIGLKLRLDGDPYWTYLTTDPYRDVQNWDSLEALCRPAPDAHVRRIRMDGRGVEVAPHPSIAGHSLLTHLRFVPAPAETPAPPPADPSATAAARSSGAQPPPVGGVPAGRAGRRFVAGLADTPDVSFELAAESFEEGPWRETLWQHAAHGVDTVYWRVDGQCSDFHTRIGTVRYSVPRTHALYSPVSRYFGLALERLDPLRIAVDEARRWDLRLFGWMRANNYSGNAVARYFVDHPEWHEVREDGSPAAQLCFAFPEVRAHKIAILCEAAAYGLQGLLIDTLRHPPMVGYAPIVVGAYQAEYGEEPPDPGNGSSWDGVDARSGGRWERWHRFRARYFTAFIRELRQALAGAGLGRMPVHVRVAPRRHLHDGADLESLLEQHLIDGVIANRYNREPMDYELLFPLIRGRVPYCAVCDPERGDPIEMLYDLAADPRLDGIGVYESEWVIHTPSQRGVLAAAARRFKSR